MNTRWVCVCVCLVVGFSAAGRGPETRIKQATLSTRSTVSWRITQADRLRLLLTKLTLPTDMKRESVKNTYRKGASEADIFCCQSQSWSVFWLCDCGRRESPAVFLRHLTLFLCLSICLLFISDSFSPSLGY